MRIKVQNQSGGTLITTWFITGLVTVVVVALLYVVQRQNSTAARSATWNSEIPIAEAGVEEAMAHINSRPKRYYGTNGWVLSGTNAVKQKAVGDGYFYTAISTAKPPVIVSVGYGRIGTSKSNYTHRTVLALTVPTPPFYGIRVKTTVTMNGSGSDWPWVDAYDSSDSEFSTFPSLTGGYDGLKRKDTAGVGTLSTAAGAINTGSGEIWGFAATGPGGTVIGTVGDGVWNTTTSGLQPGHVRDDFNGTMTNATLPSNFSSSTATIVNSANRLLLTTRDYKIVTLDSSITVLPNQKVRLWVSGDVNIGGGDAITIMPGGSLEIYIGGSSADFSGNGVVNETGVSTSCKIIGLPTCTSIKYGGGFDLIGSVYAPNANVVFRGNAQVYGALSANSLNCSGSSGIHYDEATYKDTGPSYTISRWEEL